MPNAILFAFIHASSRTRKSKIVQEIEDRHVGILGEHRYGIVAKALYHVNADEIRVEFFDDALCLNDIAWIEVILEVP